MPSRDASTPDAVRAEVALRIEHARATNAIALDLSNLPLTELPVALSQLGVLESLNLSATHITNLSQLARLGRLRSLNLNECYELDGDLSSLAELTNLESLDLTRCYAVTNLFPIGRLAQLRELDLSVCGCLISKASRLTSRSRHSAA